MSWDDTGFMKTLCMMIFTVFLAFAFAEDTGQRAFGGGPKKKIHEMKVTKEYKKAKEECLKSSEELRGKKLTECIVKYQKEAK